ncbi:hypothetical protein COB64_02025 [Candidatus Wolfebacteria bacterium]|nr:MAG: hypothetical protein COB64_02025 [Candidatus Wolfebacteria bacterium]
MNDDNNKIIPTDTTADTTPDVEFVDENQPSKETTAPSEQADANVPPPAQPTPDKAEETHPPARLAESKRAGGDADNIIIPETATQPVPSEEVATPPSTRLAEASSKRTGEDTATEIKELEAQVEKEIGSIADTSIPEIQLTNFKKKVDDLQALHDKILSKIQNDESDVRAGLDTLKKLKEELGQDIKEIKDLQHIDTKLQDEIKKIEILEEEIKKLEEEAHKELE